MFFFKIFKFLITLILFLGPRNMSKRRWQQLLKTRRLKLLVCLFFIFIMTLILFRSINTSKYYLNLQGLDDHDDDRTPTISTNPQASLCVETAMAVAAAAARAAGPGMFYFILITLVPLTR
jgi:amino acid transporter